MLRGNESGIRPASCWLGNEWRKPTPHREDSFMCESGRGSLANLKRHLPNPSRPATKELERLLMPSNAVKQDVKPAIQQYVKQYGNTVDLSIETEVRGFK